MPTIEEVKESASEQDSELFLEGGSSEANEESAAGKRKKLEEPEGTKTVDLGGSDLLAQFGYKGGRSYPRRNRTAVKTYKETRDEEEPVS